MIRILFCLIFLLPSFAHATAVVRTDFDGVRYSTTSGVNSAFVGTYYIDPSQATNGTGTIASPFNDWTSVTWAAGCRYYQKRGTTYTLTTVNQKGIAPTVSGTVDLPIVVADYGSGVLPIIEGTAVGDGTMTLESLYGTETPNSEQTGIYLAERSYINVENFVITHIKRWGVACGPYTYPVSEAVTLAQYLNFRNIETKYCDDIGFQLLYTANYTLTDCIAHHCYDDGFQMGWRGSNGVYTRCKAYSCALYGGIDATSLHGGGGGFHTAAGGDSNTFIDCEAYDTGSGMTGTHGDGFYTDGAPGSYPAGGSYNVFIRCISYNNSRHGFQAHQGIGNKFYFCTSYGNGSNGFSYNDCTEISWNSCISYNNQGGFVKSVIDSNTSLSNSVHNCIAMSNVLSFDSDSVFTQNYNLAYNNTTNNVYGANSVQADPLFTNVAAGDFTISTGSPAENAGNYTTGVHDTYADPDGVFASDSPNIGVYQ